MIVLDTHVVSEAMKPEPHPAVRAWLNDQAAETLYLTSVTLAELLFGIGALPAGKRKDMLALVKMYREWAKKAKLPNADKVVTNDPMEATYIGIHMWKQAVEKAKSTDTDKVIAAMAGQTFKAPSGIVSKMDEKNHHLHKSVFIGEVKADGQFNVVWKTPGPIKAQPWSPFIAGNDKKKDEPEVK